MVPKKWKAGIADETWKVIICGRDLNEIDRLLSWLASYLTDKPNDQESALAEIRTMSGAQIIDALEAHKRTSLESVQNALKPIIPALPKDTETIMARIEAQRAENNRHFMRAWRLLFQVAPSEAAAIQRDIRVGDLKISELNGKLAGL